MPMLKVLSCLEPRGLGVERWTLGITYKYYVTSSIIHHYLYSTSKSRVPMPRN